MNKVMVKRIGGVVYMAGFYDVTASLVRKLYDSRLSDPPVLEVDKYFTAAKVFSDQWRDIRTEALNVADNLSNVPQFHELMPSQAEISTKDKRDWRMFVLKAYGIPIKQNMAQCPTMARLLSEHPEVLTATFSCLAPHKHIPRHRGPFRGIIRYYLGLDIPVDENGKPCTSLILDDIEHRISNGEYLLWDDTYPHEVRNNSENGRIALLLDIKRNNMPLDMRLLSRLIIAVISTGMRLKRNSMS